MTKNEIKNNLIRLSTEFEFLIKKNPTNYEEFNELRLQTDILMNKIQLAKDYIKTLDFIDNVKGDINE